MDLSIKDSANEGTTHFRAMDDIRQDVTDLNSLKDKLRKSSQEFKSPKFGLVFHPEDVEASVQWFKKRFPQDVMPLVAGTGEAHEDPVKADQDDWRIRIGWFDVNTEERVDEPDWYDPDFEEKFIAVSMMGPGRDLDEEEKADIVIPNG